LEEKQALACKNRFDNAKIIPLERIGYLIEKLRTQYESRVEPHLLLQLVQLLQNELQPLQTRAEQTNHGGVSVVMPAQVAMRLKESHASVVLPSKEEQKLVFELEIEPEEEVIEQVPESVGPTPTYQPEPSAYTPPPPRPYEAPPVQAYEPPPTLAYQPKPISEEPVPKPIIKDVPTEKPFYQSPEPAKDYYNRPVEEKRSVNDSLDTAPKKELGNVLLQEPIKDLKRAISINDRYQFINHLFKGDETTYERSIKTINNFNVYSEAEFWIRRELAIKFSWREDDPLVKQFNHLVSRRFM